MTSALYGRDAQARAVLALLEGARACRSGSLVVRGEAGIGKTALLGLAERAAEGMTVLRATAIETEAELPFAGLHLLLRPVLGQLATIPRPQSDALMRAFGLADAHGQPDGDVFLSGVAVLSLLTEITETGQDTGDRPVLCLIDDAQWLDSASATALLFAARRLDAEGVAILLAVRDGARPLNTDGIEQLHLDPLDDAAAGSCSATRGPALTRSLANGYSPTRRATRWPSPSLPTPPSRHHRAASTAALGHCLPPAHSAALRATGRRPPRRDPPAVARRRRGGCRGTRARADRGAHAWHRCRRAHTGRAGRSRHRRRGRDRLPHPLVRTAVYHDAPLAKAAGRHRALADALAWPVSEASTDRGTGAIGRRAWHLASAAAGHDDRAADELAAAAEQARHVSGYAAVTAAYERAAELTTDPAVRARKVARRRRQRNVGQSLRADRLLRAAEGLSRDPLLRAEARDRARPRLRRRPLREPRGPCGRGAGHHGSHPDLAALMLRGLVVSASNNGQEQLAANARASLADLERATGGRLGKKSPRRRTSGSSPASRRGAAATMKPRWRARPASRPSAGSGAWSAGSPGRCTARDWPRRRTASGRPRAPPCLGAAPCRRHRAARPAGPRRRAARRARRDHRRRACLPVVAGGLPAGRHLRRRLELRHRAPGRIEVGRGRSPPLARRVPYPRASGKWRADTASGTSRISPRRRRAAVTPCGPQRPGPCSARGRRTPPAVGPRGGRALSRPDRVPAGAALRRSPALARQAVRPPVRGRPYPPGLRRVAAPGEARQSAAAAQLTSAVEAFDTLGATTWAERARAELAAVGQAAARAKAPGVLARLTPQEYQIVMLAARGLSNREIAVRLFLSHRTVGYHLYKAYPKLDVSARAQLAALIADQAPAGQG